MFSRSNRTVSVLGATALAASVALLGTGSSPHGGAAAATSPFAAMAGSWSGEGTIKMSTGDSERIRCRVTYALEGTKLRQNLRCASDSYKLDVKSELSYNAGAGRVSGTWSETNYGVGGFLSGSVVGGQIRATVEGQNFAATVDVTTNGNQQSVTIRPQRTDVSEVAVTLRRAAS